MRTKPAKLRDFSGKWRITEMSEWDKEFCDMEVKAFIGIGIGGGGEFQFGLVQGSICGELKKRGDGRIFDFTWEGGDDSNEASGDGWMELLGSNTAQGVIRFHGGDSSRFLAKRKKAGKGMGKK